MSGRGILAGIAMVALASVAGAQSQLVPPPRRIQVPPLKNGLRVITHEDHSAPVINLQVWYHVGSKDARPGRTGFAHLFEHLMFKGSKSQNLAMKPAVPGNPARLTRKMASGKLSIGCRTPNPA